MKRFGLLLGAALVGFALVPNLAQAQVIVVQSGRVYAPPVITYSAPPVVSSYYLPPPVTTTYSYYPRSTVITQSAPPIFAYAAPPVVTYAPPAVIRTPGVVETRSYYGLGILRPRGLYTETRVYP